MVRGIKWVGIFVLVFGFLACGNGSGSDPVDMDEMHGLVDDNLILPPGEEWTEGEREQATGSYDVGSLINADEMLAQGPGFVLVSPNGGENFSTYDLIAIITRSAAYIHSKYPSVDPLRVGELSRRKGGPSGGHESHQNGLDADLSYYRLSGRTALHMNFHMFGDPLVQNKKVTADFDYEKNYAFVKALASSGRVARIFTAPAIKVALCKYAKSIGDDTRTNEALRILRPYPGHGDHMHVRITCPQKSPRCKNQAPVGLATGC